MNICKVKNTILGVMLCLGIIIQVSVTVVAGEEILFVKNCEEQLSAKLMQRFLIIHPGKFLEYKNNQTTRKGE